MLKKKNGQGRILKVFDKEINSEIFVVEIAYYTQYNNELWCIVSKEKSTKKIKYEENITNNIFLKTGFCKGNNRNIIFKGFNKNFICNNIIFNWFKYANENCCIY